MPCMRSSSRLEQRPKSIGNKILIEAVSLVYLSAVFPLMGPPVYQALRTGASGVTVDSVAFCKFDWFSIKPLGLWWRSDQY